MKEYRTLKGKLIHSIKSCLDDTFIQIMTQDGCTYEITQNSNIQNKLYLNYTGKYELNYDEEYKLLLDYVYELAIQTKLSIYRLHKVTGVSYQTASRLLSKQKVNMDVLMKIKDRILSYKKSNRNNSY